MLSAPPALDAPPQSEAHASESAQAKLAEYTAVVNAILNEGGASPERISTVATSPFTDEIFSSFKSLSDNGATITGDIINTVTDSAIADGVEGDDPVSLGQATITTCFDSSQRTMTLADGSPGPMPKIQRFVAAYTVSYLTSADDWFITNQVNNGDTC
jgi:hypothetical protein